MSLRLEMLQVARLAPTLLHEAADRVADYLRSQFNSDGGVRDRSGASDLYYTVFGLEGLAALQVGIPQDSAVEYLRSFSDGASLDLVHLACLARCWASLPREALGEGDRRGILARLEHFRRADGAYAADVDEEYGTAYHSFLAYGAHQDLGHEFPGSVPLRGFLEGLMTAPGGYANSKAVPVATTPTTAAVMTLQRHLGGVVSESAGPWLLGCVASEGGFLAAPSAPMPDLLSTATALHALAGCEISFEAIREPCLDFVDTLWTGQGFCGTWSDADPDAEYTYYGLLALGHLSL